MSATPATGTGPTGDDDAISKPALALAGWPAWAPSAWTPGSIVALASRPDRSSSRSSGSPPPAWGSWPSANAIGCAIGAFFGGRLGDRLGRKRIYQWDLLVYALGIALIALAVHPAMLFVGTVVVGSAE